MRRWLAIAALSTAMLAVPAPAQMRGGSRGGASMGRGGFSSSGFRGGASRGVAPRFGASSGTGLRQPAFQSGRSFGGFRGSTFGSRRFHNRIFFSSVYPGYSGYYGYPVYYGGDFYSPSDSYSAYDYYGSPYYSAQNDVAQQQHDIDRLEEEVARLREQREADQPAQGNAAAPQPESSSEASTPTLLVFPRQAHAGSAELCDRRRHALDFW